MRTVRHFLLSAVLFFSYKKLCVPTYFSPFVLAIHNITPIRTYLAQLYINQTSPTKTSTPLSPSRCPLPITAEPPMSVTELLPATAQTPTPAVELLSTTGGQSTPPRTLSVSQPTRMVKIPHTQKDKCSNTNLAPSHWQG